LSILIKDHVANKQEIEVSIADTGPGIPKEILERIFDPYVSGKKTGTGLGLSITKRMVDAHQGRIEVDSFTSGTIFRIFFIKDMEEN
jgi:signal transduction histidine kinase